MKHYIDFLWISQAMEWRRPRTVCECGVGPLEISIAKQFIGCCQRFLLIEPNPTLREAAERAYGVKVLPYAIASRSGQSFLVENAGSSYLETTWAPTPKPGAAVHVVECRTFDTLDDGQIDVLSLDCEGMEFAVLEKMRSRPRLLGVEVWEANPYREQIYQWLHANMYRLRIATGPTGETQLWTL